MKEILMEMTTIALPVILGYIVWLLKEQRAERNANNKGMILLLRVKMIEYHKEWTERGYITAHGIENFLEMYDAYHSLGGNGMVTHLKEDVQKLEIRG